ncbi:hypothetical protein CsSME_00003062 [Camellia sinensis var. sinensis]
MPLEKEKLAAGRRARRFWLEEEKKLAASNRKSYISTLRNNVRSRAWGAAIGCSYRVERCCIVKKGGGTIDLEPCLTHTSTVEPTLAPVAVERTMTTRAAASDQVQYKHCCRQGLEETTVHFCTLEKGGSFVFGNSFTQWRVNLAVVVVGWTDWNSERDEKGQREAEDAEGEVCVISRTYELCFIGEKMVKAATSSQTHDMETEKSHTHNLHSTNGERTGAIDGDSVLIDVFRWSRCKKPLPQKVMRSIGIPLPLEHLEVLEENLDWEDIKWSQTGVFIAGKEYPLARVHFLSP